jgi:hypothetical protein
MSPSPPERGTQIDLICMSRTIAALWRDLRQIGGSVRAAVSASA